ncbi:hypothetical protein [Mitsuaria sp. 7]|uniref:hypothetical protein n=1 Tax=Mitsuaria sp. 7 TaxID=1658665 RepID=UPI0012F927C8|nr:hypothetical protein [Mitsuaria sp. 7]
MSDDTFPDAYRVFADALAVLASAAEKQCESVGDFNVAWELKDEVQAGRYLVGKGHLDAEQEAWISALVCALDAVPATTLPAGSDRASNLAAMQHPAWIPLRVLARHALEALPSTLLTPTDASPPPDRERTRRS